MLTATVQATIKYRNLVGQRYVSTHRGEGVRRPHPEGEQRRPADADEAAALDLFATLFGGFPPMLQALSPADMNRVSFENHPGLPGRGPYVESLIFYVASLTAAP